MAEIRQTDNSDFSEIATVFSHPSLLLDIKHPQDDFISRLRPLIVGEDLPSLRSGRPTVMQGRKISL